MKGLNIFLEDGFEDIEALAVSDALRRGGFKVSLVSCTSRKTVRSSHGVNVEADCLLEDVLNLEEGITDKDVMIFPGGMPGSRSLAECAPLIEAMRRHFGLGGTLAAICAAPGLVLSQLGSLSGYTMTCFDGFEQALIARGAKFVRRPAVRSGRIITGRSAGYAVDFGLRILEAVSEPQTVEKVRGGMLLDIE